MMSFFKDMQMILAGTYKVAITAFSMAFVFHWTSFSSQNRSDSLLRLHVSAIQLANVNWSHSLLDQKQPWKT